MALLIIGAMASPVRGTVAYLTSAASSTGSTFQAATVTLNSVSPTWSSAATLTAMYPGQATYGAVTVTNNGNASLRYSLSTVCNSGATACALAEAMTLAVKYKATSATCDATGFSSSYTTFTTTTTSDGSAVLAAADGTTVYKVGNPTAGSGNADNHTLAPGASEYLCMQITLPATKATSYASVGNKSITVTFNFVAVQASGL